MREDKGSNKKICIKYVDMHFAQMKHCNIENKYVCVCMYVRIYVCKHAIMYVIVM